VIVYRDIAESSDPRDMQMQMQMRNENKSKGNSSEFQGRHVKGDVDNSGDRSAAVNYTLYV
jgi:hypothetical protein